MSHALILLLVAVSSVAVSQACYSSSSCTSNCQWTSWSTVGDCSASCGYTGTRRRYRKETQRGSCSQSECSKPQTVSKTCTTPCTHGRATGFGCDCPSTHTGRCCELASVCKDLKIVRRKEWNAQSPNGNGPSLLETKPVKILFIHHVGAGTTCTNDCAQRVRNIQADDLKKPDYTDIGYSYLVGDDGKAYEGRGWAYQGGHTFRYNDIAVGICAIGNFENEPPSEKLIQTIKQLIACAEEEGVLDSNGYEIFGHRDGGRTECPGQFLYDAIKKFNNFSNRLIPKYCFMCANNKIPKENVDKPKEKV